MGDRCIESTSANLTLGVGELMGIANVNGRWGIALSNLGFLMRYGSLLGLLGDITNEKICWAFGLLKLGKYGGPVKTPRLGTCKLLKNTKINF